MSDFFSVFSCRAMFSKFLDLRIKSQQEAWFKAKVELEFPLTSAECGGGQSIVQVFAYCFIPDQVHWPNLERLTY